MQTLLEVFPADVRIRLGIDLAAMLLLVFGLYYRRYRDKPSNMIEDTEYGKTYLLGLNYKL